MGETVLEHKIKELGLRMVARHMGRDAWGKGTVLFDKWRCDITNPDNGHRICVTFRMGEGYNGKRPELSQVMESIVFDADSGGLSYREFLDEFGYEGTDNEKGIWRACVRMRDRVFKILNQDDFDTMVSYGQDEWSEHESQEA